MSHGMTIEECQLHIGECVRIERSDGKNQHRGRGKITGIDGKKALVLPFGGHKREEPMDPKLLTLWTSRNAQNQEIQMSRLAEVAEMDEGAAALLANHGSNGNGRNPWSNKPQSGRTKKEKRHDRRPVQMEALPPERTPDWPPQAPMRMPDNLRERLSNPSPKERATTMNKQEWLRKHCGIVFDCLVNGVQEVFKDPQHKASVEATERILQTLVSDASFVGLDEAVVPNAIPLINAFASGELDENAGEITLADLEELLAEKRILKRQKQIDPLAEIRSGRVDRKEVLQALIGPDGFKSTSELATFVLRELRGIKVD